MCRPLNASPTFALFFFCAESACLDPNLHLPPPRLQASLDPLHVPGVVCRIPPFLLFSRPLTFSFFATRDPTLVPTHTHAMPTWKGWEGSTGARVCEPATRAGFGAGSLLDCFVMHE